MSATLTDILDLCVGAWDAEDALAEHLTFIEDVELAEPDYSFDLIRVYVRKHDGMILWAMDSGCSCPSPFEDVKVRDLKESTSSTFIDAAMKGIEDDYSRHPEAVIRRELADALAKAIAVGAR